MRDGVKKVTKLIKEGNRPTSRDISDSLGIGMNESQMFLEYADAWIYREKIDELLEQLRTGELEGVKPIATLDGGKKK